MESPPAAGEPAENPADPRWAGDRGCSSAARYKSRGHGLNDLRHSLEKKSRLRHGLHYVKTPVNGWPLQVNCSIAEVMREIGIEIGGVGGLDARLRLERIASGLGK